MSRIHAEYWPVQPNDGAYFCRGGGFAAGREISSLVDDRCLMLALHKAADEPATDRL